MRPLDRIIWEMADVVEGMSVRLELLAKKMRSARRAPEAKRVAENRPASRAKRNRRIASKRRNPGDGQP